MRPPIVFAIALAAAAIGLALGFVFAARSDATPEAEALTEVALLARPLNDGRVELALEHHGLRLQPTHRFLSAEQLQAPSETWLRSSTVELSVPYPPPLPESDQGDWAIVWRPGGHDQPANDGVAWQTTLARYVDTRGEWRTGLHTFLWLGTRSVDGPADAALLGFACRPDLDAAETYVLLRRDRPPDIANITLSDAPIQLRLDDDPWRTLSVDDGDAWRTGHHQEPLYLDAIDRLPPLDALTGRRRLDLELTNLDGDRIVASFPLDSLFDTPVQPNLDHCGNY